MAVEFVLESPISGVVDWVSVTVPPEVIDQCGSDQLRFRTKRGEVFPVVLHQPRGNRSVSVRVACSFAAEQVLGSFEKADHPPSIEFALHSSLEKVPLPIVGPGWELASHEVVASSGAERLERFALVHGVDTIVVWRRTRSLHPVVDYGVRWTRGRSSGWMPSVRFPGVERLCLQPWCDYEDVSIAQGESVVPPQVDDRCAPTVWLRAVYPARGPEQMLEARLRETVRLQAPVGVCASFRTWDREFPKVRGEVRWGVLGLLPTGSAVDVRDILDHVDPSFVVSRSIYARRPGAQALRANQAGTQRFGCAEGFALTAVSPLRAFSYLRQMAGDEELRPIHYYLDGLPLRAADHPKLRTHNRRLDWRNTEVTLGFVTEPSRIAPTSDRTTDDEQHMDDLGIDAFLCAFEDPALEETRVLALQLDMCDTQLLSGRVNSAARGVGRPLLSLASAAHVLPKEHADSARVICGLTVEALANTWEGKDVAVDRPVRCVSSLTGVASWALTNPRTGEPMRAAAPYEHATVIVGCAAAAMVVKGPTREIALGLVRALGESLFCWAHTSVAGDPEFPFIVGMFSGKEDGNPLPAEWGDPRHEAFSATRVTGGSWTAWTLPGVLAYGSLRGFTRVPPALSKLCAEMVDRARGSSTSALHGRFFAIDPMLKYQP